MINKRNHISMLPIRLGWLRRSSTFLLNIRYSLLCCMWVLASTFSQLRWRTLRRTWRLISFQRSISLSSQLTPKSSIMWKRVLDSLREQAKTFKRSLWWSVGKLGKSRQNTFMINFGMFVAFRFFFSGFSIRRGSTLSNGFISCLGSKTTFLTRLTLSTVSLTATADSSITPLSSSSIFRDITPKIINGLLFLHSYTFIQYFCWFLLLFKNAKTIIIEYFSSIIQKKIGLQSHKFLVKGSRSNRKVILGYRESGGLFWDCYYNIYNIWMSNYLEKYHLKKVEPVKCRVKINYQDYLKMQHRPEKVEVVKVAKPKIPPPPPPHRNYFQKNEMRTPIKKPKTEPHSRGEPNIKAELCRSQQKRESSPQEKQNFFNNKSLCFKSSKDNSTGTKIINSIQDFFTRILQPNDGCNCGNPCPWGRKFFVWVDVSFEIIRSHYQKMQSKWQDLLLQEQEKSPNHRKNEEGKHTVSTGSTGNSSSQKMEENKKNLNQIMKDVVRTQSQSATFQNPVFKERLKKILMCCAYEDGKVGYVQGMNMILSGLLYHIRDEVRTYAVFRKLLYVIRNLYLHNFQECYNHISQIRSLLSSNVKDLALHFDELGVDLNVICFPWVLSLLTCLVPLEYLHLVYEGFIDNRWKFIYCVTISIFLYHKDTIMEMEDHGDILTLLSSTNEKRGSFDWEDIITFANSLTI